MNQKELDAWSQVESPKQALVAGLLFAGFLAVLVALFLLSSSSAPLGRL